jgi:hypothetical protein
MNHLLSYYPGSYRIAVQTKKPTVNRAFAQKDLSVQPDTIIVTAGPEDVSSGSLNKLA